MDKKKRDCCCGSFVFQVTTRGTNPAKVVTLTKRKVTTVRGPAPHLVQLPSPGSNDNVLLCFSQREGPPAAPANHHNSPSAPVLRCFSEDAKSPNGHTQTLEYSPAITDTPHDPLAIREWEHPRLGMISKPVILLAHSILSK